MADDAAGEEVPVFELGDQVIIVGGRHDQTRGRIYYMDGELIRILPGGVSDRLIDLPLVEGDFSEDLGIENFYLASKAPNPAFVAQIDAQVGQLADTFAADGAPGVQYTIESINEGEDTMVLTDESGGRKELNFRGETYRGIERSEPFAVLRPRYKVGPEEDEGALGEEDAAGYGEDGTPEEEYGFEDVEIPEPEEEFAGLQEISATMRFYPDSVQRNEMFTNLLEMLDIKLQKMPRRQREMRQLTEQLLLLRNELVRYGEAGDPDGQISTSYQTIAELLEKSDIPMARPVLAAKKSLYLLQAPESENPTVLPGVNVDVNYLSPNVAAGNNFLETQLGGAAAVAADALPAWYLAWETFFRTYARAFLSAGEPGEAVVFRGDKEFLRAPVPKEGAEVDGLPRQPDKKALVTVDAVGSVRISLMKGLGPRSTRVKAKDPQRRVESGEEGVIVNQLLFPLSTERDLGVTRSGSIARDIERGMAQPKWMELILEELGGVPDEASAGGVLSIGEGGNTMGQIALDDWLKAQPLSLKGLGDALVQMKSLGMTQKELTADQQSVLVDKINKFRALLKQFITEGIEDSKKQLGALRLENKTFLQGEALEELMAVLSTEPLLATRMEEIRKRTPAYKDNDIALVAGISAQMADLFLASMSGQPMSIARERNRRVRDQFLEALRAAMMRLRQKEMAGQEPTPNKCPHVADLERIRKDVDAEGKPISAEEKMKMLAAFVTNYKKGREGNWLTCTNCSQRLLCCHEELLLHEFKHPQEKETIHKELILAYSGGQFHGSYMCKNCGQGISEMDFDRNLEFTEDGVPLAGGAVLEDTRAAEEKALEELVAAGTEEEIEGYGSEQQRLIYKTAAKIYERVGIYPETDSYKGIIERVEAEIHKQPNRTEYARMLKARAAKGDAKAASALDYDVLINRILVSAVGAHVILDIQTHIPDYVPRYRLPGVVAGFGGWPLGREDDKTCLNYVSFAIAGIRENAAPWSLTGFLAQASEKKRVELVTASVGKILTDSLKTALVQQMLVEKRAHYEKVYGRGIDLGISETVPPGFRPVPYAITPEEAAQAVVVPNAAGPQEMVRAWIQTGHRLARQNGTFIRGSPFSETTCCYTPVTDPRGFWTGKEGAMPALPPKTPPVGQHGSQVMFPFTPRKAPRLLADAPEELFYRVFLRVCFDGPRKGLPHEPGYTNTCPHCGFHFSQSPYVEAPAPPLTKDGLKEWQEEMNAIITKGKADLEAQKIVVNKSTFEDVLDASHRSYKVAMPERVRPVVGMELLDKLARLEPEPFEGWRAVMAQTITRVSALPPASDEVAVADAYGPLSNAVVAVMGDIERRLGADARRAFESLLEKPTVQIAEVMRTYFLLTFKRLVTGFNTASLRVLDKYELPEGVADDIHKELDARMDYLNKLRRHVKGYTLTKLQQASTALGQVLPILQKELRPALVPGGELGLPYIVGGLLTGILGEFINPNVAPREAGGAAAAPAAAGVEATARVPLNILEVCLARLQQEGLNYTDVQIREMLARRVEAEKVVRLQRMDRMTPEEKRVTLMNQRLGLKEYAVGGTKAIYLLDEAQYERERVERAEMGIGAEFGANAELQAAMAHFHHEEHYGGGGMGAEGGYDNAQQGADDF